MDNYIVSARKYRPSTFYSVVGQKSLTTTLKNAIANNKLAHAYLFCGPRGVGKTTCARIFAKTINCFNKTEDGEACNACESCLSFNENRSYNIHELDAASNNSVDDIRSLIEQVRIPPQIGKYKVYIIDEVHMLSTAAFNAFLKTLEEPPHHAIFILATTEKHKILPTILSRCQIYDFNRININDTIEHLQYVAQQEGVQADVDALNVIAQKSDGGMRDALSIFDQVVSFTGGMVTYQAVIDNLNVLDYEYYFKLTLEILKGDVGQSLLIFNEILGKGFDGQHFVTGLTSFFRDLLVAKDPATLVLFDGGDAVKEKYKACAQACSNEFLYKAIELSNECDLNYRASRNKRLLVELTLIRLCQFSTTQVSDDKKKTIIEPVSQTRPEISQSSVTPVTSAGSASVTAPAANSTHAIERTIPNLNGGYSGTKRATQPVSHKTAPEGAISISLKKKTSQNNPDNNINKVDKTKSESVVTDFNEDDLKNAWKLYAEQIEDNVHLKNTMLTILPVLKADYVFDIAVYNPEQEQKLQEESVRLLVFLREHLKNFKIRMNVFVTDAVTKQIAITDAEKYKLMVAKNPSLQNLVNEFGLRLD